MNGGWVDFPRPKTEVDRRCPLWPETLEALRAALENRPKANGPSDAGCVFLTCFGVRWVRLNEHEDPAKRTRIDSTAQGFRKVLKKLEINGKRGFYALRHTFETVAGESRDQVSVDHIMGHSDSSMAATYRHHISDQRLQDVVNVVRAWLWPRDDEGDSR